MPAELSIDAFKVWASDRKSVADAGGAFSDDVFVQFVCQTDVNTGEHNHDNPPDAHVRPSHAAFHGKVFALRDAPIPPLDYGCRCAIRYVAAPGSRAANVFPEAPDDPTTPVKATEEWLKKNVDDADALLRAAGKASSKKDALSRVTIKAKALDTDFSPRMLAEMAVDVAKSKNP